MLNNLIPFASTISCKFVHVSGTMKTPPPKEWHPQCLGLVSDNMANSSVWDLCVLGFVLVSVRKVSCPSWSEWY